MTGRVTNDFMLIGNLSFVSAEDALFCCSSLSGDCCFALPNSETRNRALWICHEAN